jgi:hypothetical protein
VVISPVTLLTMNDLLAGDRRRHRGHLDDLVGDVPRRVLPAEPGVDLGRDATVERDPVRQLDEHRHEEAPARQIEVDHDRVVHLRDGLEHVVDLGGADPDAEPVQRRVRPAEHERAAPLGDPEEVALPPDPTTGSPDSSPSPGRSRGRWDGRRLSSHRRDSHKGRTVGNGEHDQVGFGDLGNDPKATERRSWLLRRHTRHSARCSTCTMP